MARVVDARRGPLLLVALVLAHLVVISRQVDGGGGATLLERVVFSLLSPIQSWAGAAVQALEGTWQGYVGLRGARSENERLREQVRALEGILQEKQDRAQEAERLRDVLGLRQVLPLETVAAEVVSRDGLPWFRSITLDKGRRDGISLNAPVLSSTGVVGRVVALGPQASKVQLLLDRDSGVGVLLERTRTTGVTSGQIGVEQTTLGEAAGSESAKTDIIVKYVSAVADVAVGDVVLTSGLDRIFPKGLMVGRVRQVGAVSGLFREVFVTPSARFDELEAVLVVKTQKEPTLFTETVR